jgi:hypothetical protein
VRSPLYGALSIEMVAEWVRAMDERRIMKVMDFANFIMVKKYIGYAFFSG